MVASIRSEEPAQVPGDAESPERGTRDSSIEKAINHTDKTEPVQSGQNPDRQKQGTEKPRN